jgi:RND family efflux transporter MFP subunit
MKKYTYIFAIIAISLFVISCGSDNKKELADNTIAIPVKVSALTENTGSPFLTASGTIEAVNSANISTRMMGYVTKVHVKVGDKVTKGQLLVSIKNTDLQAKKAQVNAGITEATAAFNNASKDYNRFKSLLADNSVSQKEFDDMTTHYEMAKARLEVANQMKNEINAQLAYSNITAPFSGIVTGKTVEVGAMANPGIPLISVETPGNFEVAANVPGSDISKISSGTLVNVLVKSINKTIKGKVTEVSHSALNTGGQYMVKIALDKTDVPVLSGMFVTVQFPVETQKKTEMVLVPKEVLVTKGQLYGIYTVSESSTALLRWLRLGRAYGNQVEVLSGLSANESYIISADGKLFNGAKVNIQ